MRETLFALGEMMNLHVLGLMGAFMAFALLLKLVEILTKGHPADNPDKKESDDL